MKLYNTLTRKIEPFKPLHNNTVKLYTCGPTVYNYYHIGNLRNAVFNDTLRRVLEANDYKVKHVMNITDVGHLVSDDDEGEDKLEKGAQREGKTVWEVAQHYTDAFKQDMKALNILEPNSYHSKKYEDPYPRATEFIPEQIEMIKLLLDKGFAYQTEQAIYFDVTKLPDYGELSGQKLKDKEVAARKDIITDENKHSPHDFAVWFFTVGRFEGHTMHWDSPWGDGFPGWHLECSAIVHSVLGDPIDIHTGGIDHIGTHHPNEMAQTEAAYDHQLSRFWVHNEFVLVDGTKMAKSKNNAYVLEDIKKHKIAPLAYRLLVLQAHYRTELNFSWDNLVAAQNRLNDYGAMADQQWQTTDSGKVTTKQINDALDAILTSLSDDLNTPEALATLSQLETIISDGGINSVAQESYKDFLQKIDQLLGLQLSKTTEITQAQKTIINVREEARQSKDFNKSDELRDKLKQQNISLRDTSHGPVWSKARI